MFRWIESVLLSLTDACPAIAQQHDPKRPAIVQKFRDGWHDHTVDGAPLGTNAQKRGLRWSAIECIINGSACRRSRCGIRWLGVSCGCRGPSFEDQNQPRELVGYAIGYHNHHGQNDEMDHLIHPQFNHDRLGQ